MVVRRRLRGPLVVAPYGLSVAPAEHAAHRGSTPPASARRRSIFSARDAVRDWLNEGPASCAALGSDVSALCDLKVISRSRFQSWQNEFGDEEDRNAAARPDGRNYLTRKM